MCLRLSSSDDQIFWTGGLLRSSPPVQRRTQTPPHQDTGSRREHLGEAAKRLLGNIRG